MKKVALVLLAALSLALTGKSQETFKNFDEFYQAIVELNPEYNLDSLNPGDLILIPDDSREDVDTWVVDKKISSRYESICAISQWVIKKSDQENMVVAQPIPPLKKGWDWNNLWWLMFAFPVVWLLVREWRRRHLEMSPEHLGDMKHASPENIAERIKKSNPVYKGCEMEIKRFVLIRNYGQNLSLQRFKLGDGTTRRAYLKPGDTIVRVIIHPLSKDNTEYWEAKGGRKICLWPGEEFQLPEGWHFIPYASDQLEEVEQIKQMAEEVKKRIEEQPAKFAKQQKEIIADIMKNLPPAGENLESERITVEFLPIVAFGGTNSPLTIASISATRAYKEKQKTEPEA